MVENKTQDPWMLDGDSAKKLKNDSKGSSNGIVCPKKMFKGHKCAVCDAVNSMFNSQREDQIKIARRIKAKATYYGNFVFPANPDKLIIVEMGKQAGGKIIDKVESGTWRDIAHPVSGKGRCLIITKKYVDNNNRYDVDVDLEKADWDIPKSVLDNLYNLDNIVQIVSEQDIFKITELKVDESIKMRMCPPWNMEKKYPLMYLWRHWGVTPGQIDGSEPITMEALEEKERALEDRPPWDAAKPAAAVASKKKCFGNKAFFDETDPVCKDQCTDYRACGKACD